MEMEQKRIFLFIALLAILFTLWQKWHEDYGVKPATSTTTTAADSNVPPLSAQTQAAQSTAAIATTAPTKTTATTHPIVEVNTDVLNAHIDTQGGNLVKLDLIKYPNSIEDHTPTVLLNNDPQTLYVAQSGLIGKLGPDTEQGQAVYKTAQTHYTLTPGQDTSEVKLTWEDDHGVKISKIFTFQRGKYTIGIRYEINNQSDKPWSGQLYAQLKQLPPPSSGGFFGLHTYQGGALSTPDSHYEKIGFSNMVKKNLDRTAQGGWLALQQRYFLSAWVPNSAQTNHYYSRVDTQNSSDESQYIYTLGFVGPTLEVPTGQTVSTGTTLYAGPEISDELAKIAPHLDLTIDYGWLWPISVAIFAVMKHIYHWVGNWGWAIILVTILIKLVFYKLSAASYRSMAKMRKLTPQMQAIRERYANDKQKMSQATMELYRKEKANPLSGCWPILIQIPFFIALYYVLIESVELRQAPFILWIHDLSIRDPYFVLPILMGVSMFVQQRLNPPPPDPMQAKIFMLMPILFTAFFMTFPAGLVLYWLVNNCVGVLQQWYIMRGVEKE